MNCDYRVTTESERRWYSTGFKSLQFLTLQGSLNSNITFLGEKHETKRSLVIYKEKSKNANKNRKNENFENKKDAFLSHVLRIIQPKKTV